MERSCLVHGAREHVLAGARLALEQQRRLCRREALRLSQQTLQRGRRAQQGQEFRRQWRPSLGPAQICTMPTGGRRKVQDGAHTVPVFAERRQPLRSDTRRQRRQPFRVEAPVRHGDEHALCRRLIEAEFVQRRVRRRRVRDHAALHVQQDGGRRVSLHYGFEQLDQSRPLGKPPLLQMALELPDQRDHERPGLRIDRVRRPGDIDHADDALVERISDHRGGATPRFGHFAEVLLGMDVQWPAQCQRRAYRIGAAGVLMPGRAGNDMVGGHAVGEMRITVDRQQRAVRVAGDQDGARAHEIGNDRRHAGAHRVIELGVAELEAVDIRAFDPQRRRFRRRVDAVAPAAAPRIR